MKIKAKRTLEDIKYVLDLMNILGDLRRRKILDLCYEKPRKISELVRRLKCRHKVMWHIVYDMEELGLVELTKKRNEQGMPVYVKSLANSNDWAIIIGQFAGDLKKNFKRIEK